MNSFKIIRPVALMKLILFLFSSFFIFHSFAGQFGMTTVSIT